MTQAGGDSRRRMKRKILYGRPLKIIQNNPAPTKSVSVVVPILSESGNLEMLAGELRRPLSQLAPKGDWEIIFVDDGSTDGSLALLERLHDADPRIKIIHFRRTLGQSAAIKSGFDLARGRLVFTMDGDLQNDPADLPALASKLAEGCDVVCGWRKDRQDVWLTRRIPSVLANRLIKFITGLELHDSGCTLRAYTYKVAKSLEIYGEMHRLIPALAFAGGALVTEIPVRHRARTWGVSKYVGLGWGWRRPINVLLDLLTIKFLLSWFTRPIHIFGTLGLLGLAASFGSFLAVLGMKYCLGTDMTGNPFLLFGILLALVSIQMIALGLLAEILVRTYFESQDKPIYAIDRIYDDEPSRAD